MLPYVARRLLALAEVLFEALEELFWSPALGLLRLRAPGLLSCRWDVVILGTFGFRLARLFLGRGLVAARRGSVCQRPRPPWVRRRALCGEAEKTYHAQVKRAKSKVQNKGELPISEFSFFSFKKKKKKLQFGLGGLTMVLALGALALAALAHALIKFSAIGACASLLAVASAALLRTTCIVFLVEKGRGLQGVTYQP